MFKLAFTAVSLETAATALLFTPGHSALVALTFLMLHGGASAAIAIMAWPFIGRHFQDRMYWPVLLLFSIAFFIPIVGIVGFGIGLAIALWAPKATMYEPYATVEMPEFSPARSKAAPQFRSTNVRVEVANQHVPEELRLKSLLSVQEMPARTSSGLLRELLADGSDDVRLLAYGMLRNKERTISQRIAVAMDTFKEGASDTATYQAAKELAELNWELVYQNLVVGDMLRHSLKQGLYYATEAIRLRADDPGLWFLAGKLAFRGGQVEDARKYLDEALERGFPRTMALPYLAEYAFAMRDLAQVRALVQEFPDQQRVPRLAPVIQFWRPPHEH